MAKKKQSSQQIYSEEELLLIQGKKSGFEAVDMYKNNLKLLATSKVDIKCKNEKQKQFLNQLKDNSKQIVIGTGSAGTGKSYVSLAYALMALKTGDFEKVKLMVQPTEAGMMKIGLLPGFVEDKVQVYTEADKATLAKILKHSGNMGQEQIVSSLISSGLISFDIINYCRGKSFDNTLILINEAENLSKEELLLLLTRLGENSKIVISGDPKQVDRKYSGNICGIQFATEKLAQLDEVAITEFGDEDIVRNPLITKIIKAFRGEKIENNNIIKTEENNENNP